MIAKGVPRRGPRALRNERPLDAEQVVEAAVRLTRLHGLESWTLRQLAEELGCWPAVVYHHVGDREAVTVEVVDRVLRAVVDGNDAAGWRDWFETVLNRLWVELRRHPGAAQWLIANGPVVPSMLRMIDRGICLLVAAGFDDEAPVVYSTLVGAAVLHIAIEDSKNAPSHPCENAERVIGQYRGSVDHRGLAMMAVAYQGSWAAADLYAYRTKRTVDGVEVRLAELLGTAPA